MQYFSAALAPLLLPLLLGACGSEGPPSEFPPLYYAAVYGVVRQGGNPVTGIEVLGDVYTAACPPTGAPTSSMETRSGLGGTYRLLLASSSQAAGQCLRLGVAGAGTPVIQTLTETPFGTTSTDAVEDSVHIDLVIP
jgi:hypothetical protein